MFFHDGEAREVDLTPTLETPPFSALRDPETFAKAHVGAVTGGVEWTDGIGLDPDVIYAGLDLSPQARLIQTLAIARDRPPTRSDSAGPDSSPRLVRSGSAAR